MVIKMIVVITAISVWSPLANALCTAAAGVGFVLQYNTTAQSLHGGSAYDLQGRAIAIQGKIEGDTITWEKTDDFTVGNWSSPQLGWTSFGDARNQVAHRYGITNLSVPARVLKTDQIGGSPGDLDIAVDGLAAQKKVLRRDQLTPGPHAVPISITIEPDHAMSIFVRCSESGSDKYTSPLAP